MIRFLSLFRGRKRKSTVTVSDRELELIRAAQLEAGVLRGNGTPENHGAELPPTAFSAGVRDQKGQGLKPIEAKGGLGGLQVDAINQRYSEASIRDSRSS